MMLASAFLYGTSAAAITASIGTDVLPDEILIEYVGSFSGSGTSYSNTHDLGTAGENRLIIIVIGAEFSGTFSSVSIAGQAATTLFDPGTTSNYPWWFAVEDDVNESGNISFSKSGSSGGLKGHIYSVRNAEITPYDTGSADINDPNSFLIDVPAYGAILAASNRTSAVSSYDWTNVDQDGFLSSGTGAIGCASRVFAIGAQADYSVECNSNLTFRMSGISLTPTVTGPPPPNYSPIPSPEASFPNTTTAFTNNGLESGAASPWAYLQGDNAGQTPEAVTSLGGRTPHTGSYFLNTNSRTTISTNSQNYIGWDQDLDSSVLNDVDAGIVEAVFAAYRITGTTDVNDRGTMVLLALDVSDNILLFRHGNATNPDEWTYEELRMMLPPSTRKLRFGIHTQRFGSSSTEVYADNFSLTLIAERSSKLICEMIDTSDWTDYGADGTDTVLTESAYSHYSHSSRQIFRFGSLAAQGPTIGNRVWGKEGVFDEFILPAIQEGVADFEMRGAIRTRHVDESAMLGVRFFDDMDVEVGSTFTNSGSLGQFPDHEKTIQSLTGVIPVDAVSWRVEIQTTTGSVDQPDTPLFFNLTLTVHSEEADLYNTPASSVTITIPTGTVSADMTDFPVMIDLADMPPEFWAAVTMDGGDIRVHDGTSYVPMDIIYIDTGTETGILFFKADLLTASDNVFTLYYDTGLSMPEASDPEGRYAMWSDFEVVYWPVGGNYNRVDDTAPTLSGTAPTMSGEFEIYTYVGHKYWTGLGSSTVWTMAAQAYTTSAAAGTNDAVASISNADSDTNRSGMSFRNTGVFGMWNISDTWLSGGASANDVNYVFHAGHDGTTERKIRIDGGATYTGTDAGISARTAANFIVAASNLSHTDERLNGGLRFASLRLSYLSDAQIEAEAENINSPSTFYAIT